MNIEINTTTKIAIFKGKKVRKVIFQNEWWFSVIDVVEALVATDRPRKYWNDLKTKVIREGYLELSDKIGQLKLPSSDGKMYETDCANTETIFRIIQSIPSPKAEPFKRWLAKENNSSLMDSNQICFFAQLSTVCRQLVKGIEFDRFKYVFNYGKFAMNGLSTIEDLLIVQK